jgi:hypothetical protein
MTAMANLLRGMGMDGPDIQRLLQTFNANAEPFRKESDRHGS